MHKFLKRGDIFTIKKGMNIYAYIPGKYAYMDCALSEQETEKDITVGDILKIETSDLDYIMKELKKDITNNFTSSFGVRPSNNLMNKIMSLIGHDIRPKFKTDKTFDTSVYEGKYVVIQAVNQGGSHDIGFDYYPDGYYVVAKKLTKNGDFNTSGLKIGFYQSGSFTAVIEPEEIQAEGKMKIEFSR